jgi:DNA-directed RNA polymerase subunit M/transcription elongation factor TFIIS
MKFCQECQNMLYIAINEEDTNKLTYYCRNCGTVDTTITQEGHCVLQTQLKRGEQKFQHMINKFTKLDPTLPRIHSMKCPNESCKTNESGSKDPAEVIYMRYDDQNMKYVYICVECDTIWKTDDQHL